MPEAVFRVVLPLLWLGLGIGVAANRWRVRRQAGRDPLVLRPWSHGDTAARWLERTLSIGVLLLVADVVWNAMSPTGVADTIAIPAVRGSAAAEVAGLVLIALGFGLAAASVLQMGTSWRIGIDEEAPGPVVSRGLFARVRHPIYAGMLLATTGMAALTGDLLSVAVAAGAWVGLPAQARLEETFLLSRFPQEYRGYLGQTGRFWPRVRGRRRRGRVPEEVK